mmetsp:Transcript_65072/g.121249  ORF Transcript_65072/g.121249 Transcript_65072/m.121249 type:complete len:496 (-) Transcript_65072:190-1677(-)
MAITSKPSSRLTVAEFIDAVDYGQYQLHCFVICSGFIIAESALLSMCASLMKVMGDSIGLETDLGKESLIACLFAGLGAGTLLSGGLADPLGRRVPMLLGYVGMVVSAIAVACLPSTSLGVHLLLFTLGSSAGSGIPIAIITLAEVCPTSWRGLNACAVGMSYSFGEIWSGIGLRFFLPYMDDGPWHGMMIWAAFPSMAMLIFGVASPVSRYDSPIWVASKGHIETLLKGLNLMADMNGRSDMKLTSAAMLNIQGPDHPSHHKAYTCAESLTHLLSPTLGLRVVIMATMFFAKDFAFYGMSVFWPLTWQHLEMRSMLPATELCATAFLGIPGVLVAMLVVSNFPRQYALSGMAVSCAIACLLLTRLGEKSTPVGLVGAILFKVCFPTWQMITMLLPAEVFPTEVKGVAYSAIAFCGRISTLVAPLVIGESTALFLQLSAGMGLLSSLFVFLLPETKDAKQVAFQEDCESTERAAFKSSVDSYSSCASPSPAVKSV